MNDLRRIVGSLTPLAIVLSIVSVMLTPAPLVAQVDSRRAEIDDEERADFVTPPSIPTEVGIGVYLERITSVDPPSDPEASFEAEVLLAMRWTDPRLASEGVIVGHHPGVLQDEEAEELLDRIWWPDVYVTNGIGLRQKEQLELNVWPDGSVEYLERFHVRVDGNFDLHRFPFDRQVPAINFESFEWDEQFLLFRELSERTGYNEEDQIQGWTLTGIEFEIGSLREGHSEVDFSVATLEIAVDRQATYYVWNTIAPFVLIMMLSWSVLWLTETPTHERILISFIALLTIVGFHGNVASQLPRLDYWTSIDWVLALCYMLASGALIENVLVNEERKRNDVDGARRIDRVARYVFPSVFLVGALSIWIFVPR